MTGLLAGRIGRPLSNHIQHSLSQCRRLNSTSSVASRTPPYAKLLARLKEVRQCLPASRSLTLAEKILFSHLDNPRDTFAGIQSGNTAGRASLNLKLKPDRVAMQDASAQMALLQFMSCNLPTTAVPASIHCDHMIVGKKGADEDLPDSIDKNKEVYDFLQSASKRYGIEFWPPGAGIIHQTVLENYSAPGLMMLGTDSHTPNAGGLGAIAIGVGGADAVEPLVNAPWELKAPKILGVQLTGELSGWTSPKDVILHLAGRLTVRGGTGFIIEYFGPGLAGLSCTGMATICNMGAEVGATTSLFPYSQRHADYLRATNRASIADAANDLANMPEAANLLRPDAECEYDEVVTISLSELEPHINGPFTPDLSTPLSQFRSTVQEKQWPKDLSACLIGSCTNSSYEDMTRAEDLVNQASAVGLSPKTNLFVTPGSEQIRATLERDKTLSTFSEAGGTVLANACGPCIGQWNRSDENLEKNAANAILTSYNRNFPGRNDGNRSTMNFLASPEIVTAMAFAASTTFNPLTDSITTPKGEEFRFSPPKGRELPDSFEEGSQGLAPSSASADPSVEVLISPTSTRLAKLEPFAAFPQSELENLRVLVKVRGQCTTDTISAAGPWLKFKGHLPNIAENTLIGATNAATGQTNVAVDTDGREYTIPDLAKRWKSQSQDWLVVAEHNYGEGSAREHAALQPRYLGGRIILAKSFARIHETNLKKQGVVPLTFVNEQDYEKIDACDKVDTMGLLDVLRRNENQGQVSLRVTKPDGKTHQIPTKHTLTPDQCDFVLAGSALNLLAQKSHT